MKVNILIICVVLYLCSSTSIVSQNQYPISTCNESRKSNKSVGERLRLPLPKCAYVKKAQDVDYEEYNIGFGPKTNRVWLEGIYGPSATVGEIPEGWEKSSVEITRRLWVYGEQHGVDARGKLPNGNYWRYFGTVGESIENYDVSAEAAAYFDSMIDKVCFLEWK